MAAIAPFKGVLYNPEKAGNISDVAAPPYDVISPQKQEDLYQKSHYNVVRLEYGKEFQTDSETDNRYTRASEEFKKWMESGILVRDEAPAIYPYEQDYVGKDGSIKTRKGFIARVRLEEFDSGVILPHERTLSGPKTDRLKLIRIPIGDRAVIRQDNRLIVDDAVNRIGHDDAGCRSVDVEQGHGIRIRAKA